MKIKKVTALLLALVMCFSLAACGAKAQTTEAQSSDVATVTVEDQYDEEGAVFASCVTSIDTFESASLPYYNREVDEKSSIDVWYINGNTQVPYLSLDTISKVLGDAYQEFDGYEMTITKPEEDWNVFLMTRENGATMEVDFDNCELTFRDIDLFTANPGSANGMDIICCTTNGADDNLLISHTNAFYKNPNSVTINLGAYNIPMICQDGEGYLPLQTVADLLISRISLLLGYNGQEVLLASELKTTEELAEEAAKEAAASGKTEEAADSSETTAEDEGPTMGDIYQSAPKAVKSEMLKVFNYNELCMALDCSYGLKEEHEIDSFNNFFIRTGLCDQLMSDDALDTYTALSTLTFGYFADLHSGVSGISYMTELDEEIADQEYAGMDMQALYYAELNMAYYQAIYSQYRAHYYPDGCPGYEEVGNTAYITFDHFINDNKTDDKDYDYYAHEPTANLNDTIELLIYANTQIKRENSPIENVVIDLTNNGGGDADTAVCVVAWMLGSCSLCLEDTLSGAQSTVKYTFDANLDGQMDENDYLGITGRYHLYCLTSPCSFSCGNLVPAALSSSHFVTLIGDSSTGGACCVYPMTTADGTIFRISGPYRISAMNNGIYYSVDQGVDPDFYIDKIQHLYDRKYLTDYINNLP